jgi:hypothetical protein
MIVWVADAIEPVQRLVSVVKMTTVLEGYAKWVFLWVKELSAKDIHKEMFSVYGGKCLSRKAVPNWVEKFSQGLSKVADDARPGRPVEIATEATVLQRVKSRLELTGG